jgi:hypothetical protein
MAYAYLWGCGNSVKKFIDLDLKKSVQTSDHNRRNQFLKIYCFSAAFLGFGEFPWASLGSVRVCCVTTDPESLDEPWRKNKNLIQLRTRFLWFATLSHFYFFELPNPVTSHRIWMLPRGLVTAITRQKKNTKIPLPRGRLELITTNDYLALGTSLSGRGQAISHITPTQHQVVGFARRALPIYILLWFLVMS